VLAHTLAVWRALGAADLAVVLSVDSPLASELERGTAQIVNPRPELGMFESIRCAARWAALGSQATHFALVLGDQPHLHRNTLESLLTFAAMHSDDICQPSRNGRGRHPVILPRHIFVSLDTSGAQHLKDFMLSRGATPARVEIDDPGLDLDLDTPEDYKRALLEYEKLAT
jgi:molybdenum cofactor cytidylyltransferase